MIDTAQMHLYCHSTFLRLASMRIDSARRCNNNRFGGICHRLHRDIGFTIAHRSHRADTLTAPMGIFTRHRGIQIPIGQT